MLLLRNKAQQHNNALASFVTSWVCRRSGHEWTASSSLHHTRIVKLGSFCFAPRFEEISCLELLSSFSDASSLTYHSAAMPTAVTHTSESCRILFAQEN